MNKITAKTKICMIIGDPIEHSLSPAMHNAAYEALGIDDQFVHVAARAKIEKLEQIVTGIRAMGIRGLTCTIPHKIEVLKYLDEIDEVAQEIGAVNSVVNENGKLKGYNTDWLGIVTPLEKITSISKKNVLLLGAGGAARAIAYAITTKGGNLKIYNRTKEKAEELAKDFSSMVVENLDTESLKDIDIIINSTALGMPPNENETPISGDLITANHIVFDIVCTPKDTRLLKDARQKGAKIIYGIEMLLHQGTAQFELYTGHKAPEEVMWKVINEV